MAAPEELFADRYRPLGHLGEGGFASVFLAEDTRLGRAVAIKRLRPELAGDADARDRFAREARALAGLRHPYLLTIHDSGEVAGLPYLALPYLEGGSLHDLLVRGPLALPTIGRYLGQVAAALDHCHRRGIVHRDVNPHNLLLADDRRSLALGDFGIARRLDLELAGGTAPLGTLGYMAPEQLDGEAGPTVDIYALGCTLFAMLTGTPPYRGSVAAIVAGHRDGPPPQLVERTIRPLPPGLQAIIDRALASDPAERYPTAGALADAFDAARGLRHITADDTPDDADTDPATDRAGVADDLLLHERATNPTPRRCTSPPAPDESPTPSPTRRMTPQRRYRPYSAPSAARRVGASAAARPSAAYPAPSERSAYDEHGGIGGRAILIAILVAILLLATWTHDRLAPPPAGYVAPGHTIDISPDFATIAPTG